MATCKDCLHYEACKTISEAQDYTEFDTMINDAEKECDTFADKSRFVELPCKVGDTVYYLGGIRRKHIKTAIVEEIIIDRSGIRDLVVTVDSGTFEMSFSIFFATREEAEAALAERPKE